jgi:hypothetical protein
MRKRGWGWHARVGQFPHDLLHAFGGMAKLPRDRDVKRLNLGVNVLAV